jgi:NAD(P)-dependent dehydrogenase (short-subunit alcohol dehydrogenase family)
MASFPSNGRSVTADLLRFDERVAIVTGGGRGMGASHCRALAARGAKVVVNDLGVAHDGSQPDAAPAEEVAASIVAAGGQAVADAHSVSTPEGGQAIVQTALTHFGRVDIVVNNAGIITLRPFHETDADNFTQHIAVGLLGAFNVTRAAWPYMTEAGYGRVLTVASSAIFGIPIHIGYAAAKAGQIGFVKSLALAEPTLDIKVNALVPAAATRMGQARRPATATPVAPPSGQPRLQMGSPEQVSAAVLYLAHDSCELNGEIIGAGGGKVDRIFLAATPGYLKPELTPEDVKANLPTILDEANYVVPRSNMDHVDLLRVRVQ